MVHVEHQTRNLIWVVGQFYRDAVVDDFVLGVTVVQDLRSTHMQFRVLSRSSSSHLVLQQHFRYRGAFSIRPSCIFRPIA